MKLFPYLTLLTTLFILATTSGTRQFKMKRICKTVTSPTGTILEISQGRKNYDCAASCFETFSCSCFSFQKYPENDRGTCYLYTGTVTCDMDSSSPTAWSTYGFGNETQLPPVCDIGWDEYNMSCYLLVTTPIDWPSSVNYCTNVGGHLASITDSLENDFIFNLPIIHGYNYRKLWLGADDLTSEGTWAWLSGEPWVFTYFANNEPNGGTNENELAMIEDGRWIDLYWDNLEMAVCEKEL